ncbi:MAG: hypothetical protein IJ086_15475 [Clostridium sp.]|nr:hypothetical protein [Clostridium sp.]
MRLKKIICNTLIFSLLFSNINIIDSESSSLSQDIRYELFDNYNISVSNILQEDKSKIKIEGNTLENVIKNITNYTQDGILNNNSFYFNTNNQVVRAYFNNAKIKEHTTYTIFYNITKNTLNRADNSSLPVIKFNLNNYNYVNEGYIFIEKGETGLFSKTITTKDTNCAPYLETVPGASYHSGGEFEIKDILVIEGDYSDVNIDYFKDTKSSFEDNLVTQDMVNSGYEEPENLNKYKVEIINSGKNKFNGNSTRGTYNVDTGNLEIVGNATANLNPINVKPETKYTFTRLNLSQSRYTRVFFYDKFMKLISTQLLVSGNSFITPTDCRYINFHTDTPSYNPELKIQIEEGELTDYEDYKENKIVFYLKSPLSHNERIEFINGQGYHIHNANTNPSYEPINSNLSATLFEGNTYIVNNSNIPTKMELLVDRALNLAMESLEQAKSNPTIDNISITRMWANLVKESIKKDYIQNELNNLTNIKGLVINKSTISSNFDIYIKTKNALSLSLDTNNVIFEEVNGINDIEKTNAIKLTVSSSLPYKVDTYLETEIQNSDKSNNISKDILMIRATDKSNYNSFTGIKTPITLLDNQDAGNDISHGIDIKLSGGSAIASDIYKTSLRFEVAQK